MTETRIAVRGYHEDRFGHVNHARYLEFLEEARWAQFAENGLGPGFLKEHGIFPVVVRLTITYRRPANAGDVLEVSTRVASAGRRKIVIAQDARFEGSDDVAVEAELTVVFLDEATGRPVPLSREIVAAWPELGAAQTDVQ
jgi:thioesterase-3